jgi:predicted nucleic acid-binding protein
MLQVFIDTNVFLTFYSLASEDLEELRKLHTAATEGALKLFVPDQVIDELERNRESRFLEALEHVRVMRPKGGLPQMARNVGAADAFQTAQRDFVGKLNELEGALTRLFDARELGADRVLKELLDSADVIRLEDSVLDAAQRRVEVGSPPGKRGSLGDAINWEVLLAAATDGDLHLVTGDGDYTSALHKERAKPYLEKEWMGKRNGRVYLYKRISAFLKEHFPDIRVAAELEKEVRIRALIQSGSFDSTHRAVTRLESYTEFTPQQAVELLEGAVANSQITWIAHDPDVRGFFRSVLEAHSEAAEQVDAARLKSLFLDEEENEDEEQ